MIIPKSAGKYSYNIGGEEYTMTIINHSMFIGNCEVEIECGDQKFINSIPYSGLVQFLNQTDIKIKEI